MINHSLLHSFIFEKKNRKIVDLQLSTTLYASAFTHSYLGYGQVGAPRSKLGVCIYPLSLTNSEPIENYPTRRNRLQTLFHRKLSWLWCSQDFLDDVDYLPDWFQNLQNPLDLVQRREFVLISRLFERFR